MARKRDAPSPIEPDFWAGRGRYARTRMRRKNAEIRKKMERRKNEGKEK